MSAQVERPCTVCLARGARQLATHVACAQDGTEWFECERHLPTDNVARVTRVARIPISDWFGRLPAVELCLP